MHDTQTPLPIRLITHNIRYATRHPEPNEPFWRTRLPKLANTYKFHTLAHATSFICLQEALHDQLIALLASLNSRHSARPEWAYIGVGRDDGLTAGEYAPILYRPSAWKPLRWTTVWLSETPRVPGSKGWDAASVRIATVALFAPRKWICKGRRVVAVNTHLDNEGGVARREGARLVSRVVEEWTRGCSCADAGCYDGSRCVCGSERLPVFVAGDLNSEPDGEAHEVLDGEGSLVRDVSGLTEEQDGWVYGERCTFTGFQGKEQEQQVLDFLFLGPRDEQRWDVLGRTVLPNCFEDGIMHSDHRAVVADVVLK